MLKIKKRKVGKYTFGVSAVVFCMASVFLYFNPLKNKEIPQYLSLKTGTNREIVLDNKTSLHLPFVKNEGQVNEKVKYGI